MANPFDQGGENNPQQAPEFQDKSASEFFEEMVGEGKKYATPEDAVRALAHANKHISKLEGENATQREQLTKAATVDDIMSKLNAPKGDDDNTGETDQSQEPKSEPADVEALVKQLFSEQQTTATAQANKQQVVDAMSKQFGDKAVQVWDEVESQLGVDLEQLATTTPAAALQLLGVGKDKGPQDSGSFKGTHRPPQDEQRPPEGSKRLVDHMLAKGEIDRGQAYKMKLNFSADPDKYNA